MFQIIYGTIKVIFEKQPINEIGLKLVCLAFNYAALMTHSTIWHLIQPFILFLTAAVDGEVNDSFLLEGTLRLVNIL